MNLFQQMFINKTTLSIMNVTFSKKGVISTSFQRFLHDIKEKAQNENLPISLEDNPYKKPRKQCILCKYGIEPDYKNVRLLSQFQSRFTGRLYNRHITGLCKKKQKKLFHEIAKAQNAGLMGYYTKDPAFSRDPKLFDPDHPFRPHPY